MKWNNYKDELPITSDVYECSPTCLLWTAKTQTYGMGFWWPINMTWCDHESMGPLRDHPSHWMYLPKTPLEDPSEWLNENDFSPADGSKKFIWKESYLEVCLGYLKNDVWYDADFDHPLPEHCIPTHWMHLPIRP